MKPQTQKRIELNEIIEALSNYTLTDARSIIHAGTMMEIAGTVLKVVKRDGLKLHIEADSTSRRTEIFADFTDEAERQKVVDSKVKKNSKVLLTGKLISFGSSAVNLTDCQLKKEGI